MNKKNLYKLIESEFKIIEKNSNKLVICKLSEIDYPEITIKLICSEDSKLFSLFFKEKGNEYFIRSISNPIEALMALYVFARKSWDEPKYNNVVQNKIVDTISEDEMIHIFIEQFDSNNYSFFDYKKNKLILEKSGDEKYNVLFLDNNDKKIYITKDRKKNIAYLVLYNYICRLEEFYKIATIKLEIDENNIFFEELKILYLV